MQINSERYLKADTQQPALYKVAAISIATADRAGKLATNNDRV
jgi:hypothetical protein